MKLTQIEFVSSSDIYEWKYSPKKVAIVLSLLLSVYLIAAGIISYYRVAQIRDDLISELKTYESKRDALEKKYGNLSYSHTL